MLIQYLLCLILCHKIANSFGDGPPLLGPADLVLTNIGQCEDPDKYPTKFILSRKKINRTTDVFTGTLTLTEDLDDSIGINLNVAKWGDGGYKPNYALYNDTSACHFFFQWTAKGTKEILKLNNRPEECPIKKGTLQVTSYNIDYRELPDKMLYGDFKIRVIFLMNESPIMCYEWFVTSKPVNKFW